MLRDARAREGAGMSGLDGMKDEVDLPPSCGNYYEWEFDLRKVEIGKGIPRQRRREEGEGREE